MLCVDEMTKLPLADVMVLCLGGGDVVARPGLS